MIFLFVCLALNIFTFRATLKRKMPRYSFSDSSQPARCTPACLPAIGGWETQFMIPACTHSQGDTARRGTCPTATAPLASSPNEKGEKCVWVLPGCSPAIQRQAYCWASSWFASGLSSGQIQQTWKYSLTPTLFISDLAFDRFMVILHAKTHVCCRITVVWGGVSNKQQFDPPSITPRKMNPKGRCRQS